MAEDQGDRGVEQPTQERLMVLGCVSLLIYAGLLLLSFSFRDTANESPILSAVGLLGAATVVYFLALGCVFTAGTAHLRVIVGFAVAFRLLLLPSWPIQEIDFYRYLWDGRVTLAGCNPYHYSPDQIEDAAKVPALSPSE